MRNLFYPLFIVLFLFFSCTDDSEVPGITPSLDQIEMEAEGGIQLVDFTTVDWRIDRIENVTNDSKIFGDIYSIQNERINENVLLELEGEGKLDAIWRNKGFVIVRNKQNQLEIRLQENSTGEQFGFRIIISSDSGERAITVSQKASQGYEFKQIEYVVGEGDGDSLYWRTGTTLRMTVPHSQEIEFMPIAGIDVKSSYSFESNASDAFVWLQADSVEVKLPAYFEEEEIFFAEENGIYTAYVQSKESAYSNLKKTITVPAGSSEFRSEFEMNRRVISYVLVLTNNRTGEEKEITGKLIQLAPTGKYKIDIVD